MVIYLYNLNMNRLDKQLVERGLAPTRSKAQELIKSGNVKVNNKAVNKSSYEINDDDILEVVDTTTLKYVSRAGLKLEKAIDEFNLNFNNKAIMDIGSSTGGFTDCAIQHGASKVIAVDVGTNLMHESLRTSSKIELYEQTNIKDLPSDKFKNIDFVTIDVSFVSLTKIFEKLFSENINCPIIALIKPQFECGKKIADKFKGVILNQKIHLDILNNTIVNLNAFGYYLTHLTFSPITGGDGNIEYISIFSNQTNINCNLDIKQIIESGFKAHKK